MLHLALHLIVPAIVAVLFFRKRWPVAFGVMLATLVIDLDHLLADPIYDPMRCSIDFHPLHSFYAIAIYLLLTIWGRTRLVGIGLVIHMALDALDCVI